MVISAYNYFNCPNINGTASYKNSNFNMEDFIRIYGIEIFTITGKQGQKVWDTRNIKQGVYFYNHNTAGFSKSGKIIINK